MSRPEKTIQEFRNSRTGTLFSARFDQIRFAGALYFDEVPSDGAERGAKSRRFSSGPTATPPDAIFCSRG